MCGWCTRLQKRAEREEEISKIWNSKLTRETVLIRLIKSGESIGSNWSDFKKLTEINQKINQKIRIGHRQTLLRHKISHWSLGIVCVAVKHLLVGYVDGPH